MGFILFAVRKFYINDSILLFMGKKGNMLLWFILFVAVASLVVILLIGFTGDESEESEVDETESDAGEEESEQSQENNTEVEITQCSGYQAQEECASDSSNVGGCAEGTELECQCSWNNETGVCELDVLTEESNETGGNGEIYDLEAFALNLTNNGCSEEEINDTNVNVTECDMTIEGTIRNSGTSTIDTDFVVHFLDITDITRSGSELIKLIRVTDSLAPDSEKILSVTYEEISRGEYFVRMKVDAIYSIDESDEDNNFITEDIKI